MFGYIIVNKQELKFREFDVYQSYYCGLCQSLKERFGRRGQLTLSYDMTFVALLLSALYDEPVENSTCKCVAHPFEAHATSRSVFTDYAADMNLLLSYYKCLDDWTAAAPEFSEGSTFPSFIFISPILPPTFRRSALSDRSRHTEYQLPCCRIPGMCRKTPSCQGSGSNRCSAHSQHNIYPCRG